MSIPVVEGKVTEPFVIGGKVRRHTKIVAGPVLYVVGGCALDAKDLGDTWVLSIPPVISTDGSHIAHFVFPDTAMAKTVKMLIIVMATGIEAGAVDLHTKKFIVSVDSVG